MTFLGNYKASCVEEAELALDQIAYYVRYYFQRDDFPQEFFMLLADCTVASKGDLVWPNLDNEHPYDFTPMACIDQLVLNLPSKAQFLQAMDASSLEAVSPEAADKYWRAYPFEFATEVDGIKLIWT